MKKMKKFAALLLAVSMAAGMVACGSSDKKEETTKKEETKKDDKETKKLEGTLKVVTTGDAYQPLFDKFLIPASHSLNNFIVSGSVISSSFMKLVYYGFRNDCHS